MNQFDRINFVSSDAARSAAFYEGLLGLELSKIRPITLLVQPGERRGRWGIGGVHHLALGTTDRDSQLKWKRWLTDAGVPVSGPFDRGWFHSIYFTDLDGQVLEIATLGPGYGLDEPMDRLGQEVIMPKASQLRGGRDEAAIAAATWPEPVTEISDDMRLHGIHHITGFTDDIVRADEFYHQALGLRLVKKSVNQDDPATPHWFWAAYDGGEVKPHSTYTLFEWKNSDYRARPGVGQTHHITFKAETAEEVAAWRDHLRSLQVDLVDLSDPASADSVFFYAPDGQLLQIATV